MKEKKDFIFGLRPVIEVIEAGKEVEKVLFKSGLKGELYRELFEKVNKLKIPFQFVPQEKLNRLTRKNHQGVVAFISLIEYQSIENLVPMIYENGETPFILVLDRVTDVRNFGSVVRTAECAGVHAVVIPKKNAARINADAVKTSAGALYNINVCRVESLNTVLDFLKKSGIQIIAATEKANDLYYNANFKTPVALLLGSEDEGIDTELLKLVDKKVKIPVMGQTASLNVSNAAAVILYEGVKQRG